MDDTEIFTLDAVSNRVGHSETPGEWTYDANNRLTKIGNGECGTGNVICYEYDEAGNQTVKQTKDNEIRYGYDTENRLTEVWQTKKGQVEQLIARYGYDPLNRRIWKERYADKDGELLTPENTGIRTHYLYNDEGLNAETQQAITLNPDDGTTTAASEPEIIAQYGTKPNNEFTTGILFIKTKNTNGEEIFAYYHHDHLDTPIQATDKGGNVVWSASYHPFGRIALTMPPATQDKPTITSNLRYPGQYEDEETGLYYNWNRYYDPDTGRYITQDPIGLEGGINLYAYVGGDPLNLFDPTGEAIPLAVPAAVGAIRVGVWAWRAYRAYRMAQQVSRSLDRAIWTPDKLPGLWHCKARADCNDNKPGNCPENPKHRFAFGGGVASDQGTARNIAKANATSNLKCQPKHVSCVCTGPKGEPYEGGC
ncbi:MAG: RHS domain-containing protein [Betaproteobacteria bacterium]|nr:RHS domain-containing protein [Betaproteobacteria bacterium]